MMSKFYNALIRRFAGSKSGAQYRVRVGVLEGWTSIWVNLGLFGFKIVIGFWSGSIALISDAFHTLSDMATSIVVIVGFKMAGKEPDELHPFGHGRVEHITTMIVGVLLIVTGLEIGKSAFHSLSAERVIQVNWWVLLIVLATVVIKEWSSRFSAYLSREIVSGALEADAWHHRADAISSIVVLLALILGSRGIPYIDGIVGMLVAAFIIYTSYDIIVKAANHLIGTVPSVELIDQISQIANDVDGVEGIHDLVVNDYGNLLIISLHIEIDERITLLQAHSIAEHVEFLLQSQVKARATVHLDPVNRTDPLLKKIQDYLDEVKTSQLDVVAVQDVRLIGESPYQNLIFEIRLHPEAEAARLGEVRQLFRDQLQKRFPELADIQLQVDYSVMDHL